MLILKTTIFDATEHFSLLPPQLHIVPTAVTNKTWHYMHDNWHAGNDQVMSV